MLVQSCSSKNREDKCVWAIVKTSKTFGKIDSSHESTMSSDTKMSMDDGNTIAAEWIW